MIDLRAFWQDKHERQDVAHLSDVPAEEVLEFHQLYRPAGARIADIGYGTGRFSRELSDTNEVVSFDLVELDGVLDISELSHQEPFDLAICNLVAQHNPLDSLPALVPPLKPGGIFSIQFPSRGLSHQRRPTEWCHNPTDVETCLRPLIVTNRFGYPLSGGFNNWIFRCSGQQVWRSNERW